HHIRPQGGASYGLAARPPAHFSWLLDVPQKTKTKQKNHLHKILYKTDMVDQSTFFTALKNTSFQDNANEAIHHFIN
ncbi:MAG TPA: hypothetical protein VGY56_12405, partial [Verrucomicrobiae bacterium]|nr:hypothetical protein [Verrucomicrobiae bacterium]